MVVELSDHIFGPMSCGVLMKVLSCVRRNRLVVVLCMVLSAAAIFAQTTTARVLGTVTDQTGASVAGATITITDVQRGISRTVTTDDAGAYAAPNLEPGVYDVKVESKGFKTFLRAKVQIEVASDAVVDASLQPGNVSDVITVSEDVPMINTTSATLGGTLSNKEINDLPLNGRNYENLLQLRPGIVRYPGGGFSTTSSNGLRAEDNVYMVDGLFNSEPFSGQSIINGAGIAGDSATILPIDAIQEFNVVGNPPAEYGWKPGTIVNVGLKSGTNGLHGTAYAFGRDTPMDARNYFNTKDQGKVQRNLEQFGTTVGGPIVKDRLFFFGGYEGQRYSIGNTFADPSPTTSSLADAGNCPPGVTGDCANSAIDAIAGVAAANPSGVSPASLQIAGCTLGPPITCNGKGLILNTTGTVNNGLPNDVKSDNAIAKIDFHVNATSTLSGMYFFGNNSGTVQDFPGEYQPQWETLIHTRAQVAGLNWIWTPTSRLVNEARFGYNRLYQPTFTVDHNVPASTYGLNTGVTTSLFDGLPRIGIAGFGPQLFGGFNWPKVQGPDSRWQFTDHVSYEVGKHSIRFGGEMHHDEFNGGAYAGGRGRIKFGNGNDAFAGATPLEDFFAGNPGSVQYLVGDPTRSIHNWGFAGFVQDDWRITRGLTMNIGLRYELNTVVKEAHDLLGNFDPNLGLVQVGKQISAPYNGDHNNFAPRFGIAWDPFGNGKTVLRAGAGMMYETVNWESFLAFENTLGLPAIPTGGVGVTPGGGNIAVGNITVNPTGNWNTGPLFGTGGTIDCGANPCTIMAIDPKIRTPYVYNWTLNVQHAFNQNLSLEVAYVGNHGTDLVGIHDINQPTVGAGWNAAAIAGGASDPNAEQLARPYNTKFPFLASIYQMGNIYKSNYNALQTTLTGRNYHGFSFILGYTYGHALDDVGANWDFGYGNGLAQNQAAPQREYASSDFDIRHRMTLSMTYAIPGIKSPAQLLKGWQLNTIVSLYSAQPWGPIDAGTDVSGTGELTDRWNYFGKPSAFTSGPVGIPYYSVANGNSSPACVAKALSLDGGTPGLNTASYNLFGCYMKNGAIMLPPALGSFGTMSRNMFRDSGYKNVDFSLAKKWLFHERFGAEFRAEFFNVLNHPNFANPFGGQNGFGFNDPSAPGAFGCGCATPDGAAANPIIGSGGARAVQLSLKLSF
jgi:hypothetical protein